MPNGTELHVGFFAPQSKHIYSPMLALIDLTAPPCQATHFVRGLRLQLGEDVLRLRLRSERHVDGRVGMLRGWRIGGQVAVGIIVV